MYYLITTVKFILFTISSGWLFWFADQISMAWNSEWNIFKKMWLFGELSYRLPNWLFGFNVNKTR